ncbi:MAG: TraB/GumN family protein [Candidatus Krumholzibacteriota bacterium]
MMSHRTAFTARRFLLGLLAVALVAAAAGPACAGEKPVFMWQVASETATVSLVGSIHVGKPDFFPLAEPFEKAFAAAPVLAVEVDMTDPVNLQKSAALMMQKGMLPGDTTLQDMLAPELWQRVETYAAENNVNLAMYSKLKPGIVAMVLVLEEFKKQGFDPELGIDKHFLDAAREQGKEIRELESVEAQLDLFLSIDDKLDDILVAEFLDQMEDIVPITEEMVGLWQAGDVVGLDRFLQDQVGEDPAMAAFYRALLDDRNVKMAEKIDEWLKGDTDIYVVVGAGHFSGPNGIIGLMEEKGYTVEQMRH